MSVQKMKMVTVGFEAPSAVFDGKAEQEKAQATEAGRRSEVCSPDESLVHAEASALIERLQ